MLKYLQMIANIKFYYTPSTVLSALPIFTDLIISPIL